MATGQEPTKEDQAGDPPQASAADASGQADNAGTHPAVTLAAQAIAELRAAIALDPVDPRPNSHMSILVSGLETPEGIAALGKYGTALIAQVISVDLSLCDDLLGSAPDYPDELQRSVDRTIGSSNEIDENERVYRRDPWIAEAIGHLLFALAKEEANHCVPGPVCALSLPHTKVSEQGLDLVGVFTTTDGAGVCIVESKASEEHPDSQYTRAIKLFRALDRGERDDDVLQALNLFRNYLPPEIRTELAETMWSGERAYGPSIVYRTNFEPSSERPETLGNLKPQTDHKRLVTFQSNNYGQFFNDVADAMRGAVDDYRTT